MSLWEIYKAKRLGYADDLWTSLIGKKLGGYSWLSDYETTPYLYRAMPNMSHYYNREIMEEVVGGSVGWNQLCNGSSVTVQSGHKYFLKKGSATSIGASSGSAITDLTSGSDMVTDLTLALGSTIADYVYSLEQATAGSGVAWLKEHFPKMFGQYNPYDAGSIQSVSGLVSHTTKDANDNVIGSYPLDSTVTLRGIPKLDNGKLYYDGDTYGADGSVSRKYGVVVYDGSADEEWRRYDQGSASAYAMNIVPPNIFHDDIQITYMSNYLTPILGSATWGNYDKFISVNVLGALITGIQSITTVADWKAYLAQHPLEVVYELATPTTETAQPFTKTQLCDSGGTEEFVTSGIVSVGHKSKYAEK